jgi:hypothetical protein
LTDATRRIPDSATLTREIAAWETERNTAHRTVDGRFTTADARIKLKLDLQVFPT